MLKIKPFDVPERPQRITLWGPSQMLLLAVALGVFGYFTGTWLSLPLIGYVLIIKGVFAIREWRWHRYADKCEATFVQIGESMDEIGNQIDRIAVQVEARAAEDRIVAGDADPTASSVTWTGYWAAPSKGQH